MIYSVFPLISSPLIYYYVNVITVLHYHLYIGFSNANSCTTVLDIEVTWCSCGSSFIGHARGVSWI